MGNMCLHRCELSQAGVEGYASKASSSARVQSLSACSALAWCIASRMLKSCLNSLSSYVHGRSNRTAIWLSDCRHGENWRLRFESTCCFSASNKFLRSTGRVFCAVTMNTFHASDVSFFRCNKSVPSASHAQLAASRGSCPICRHHESSAVANSGAVSLARSAWPLDTDWTSVR